jgi:phosphatidylglycerophosphate synthase
LTDPGDRRPIAARDWRPIQDAAAFLIARGASPNAISVSGMIAAVVAGLLFASVPGLGQPWLAWLCGAVLVQLRLLANVLDGMVAVGRGVASPVGELYNEIPDRVSDTAVLAGIGFAAGSPALGWAAALAAMATAYVRATGRAAGGGSDFRGPMAKQQRMALVTAVAVVCAVLPAYSVVAAQVALWVVLALSLVTAGRRLSGIARALRG